MVKTFIEASQALAKAKDGSSLDATNAAEAALKTASAAIGLKEAIDTGLATDYSLPEGVKALLTDAKTIQKEHVIMDAADADVAKKDAEALRAAEAAAAKTAEAEKAKVDAATAATLAENAKAAATLAEIILNNR